MSRHHYDLDKLMNTMHGEEALKDGGLYKSIVTHRMKFNPVRGIDYTNHHPAKINFIPPEQIIKRWEKDYNNMLESMIYSDDVQSFEALITSMKELKERFRKIKF